MSLSTHRISRWSQQTLRQKKFVPTTTTFVTEKGPNVGTVWFDKENPKSPPVTVAKVMRGKVLFVSVLKHIRLSDFLEVVSSGRFVLIGVHPVQHSHVVIHE